MNSFFYEVHNFSLICLYENVCDLIYFWCIAFTGVAQVRLAHTDVQYPDFDFYRRKELRDPSANNRSSDEYRKGVSYAIMAGEYYQKMHFYKTKS